MPKEIHAVLTETLACFLLGRAKDLSAPLYNVTKTPWSVVLILKLLVPQSKISHHFMGSQSSLPRSQDHTTCPYNEPDQSSPRPHPTALRSTLTLFSHLRLGIPSGLFPSVFPTDTLYTPPRCPIRFTCPAHLILPDFFTRITFGEQYRPRNSSSCNIFESPVTSSILGPSVFLSTLYL